MAKKDLMEGIFITFEGPEGCGKSTQSKLLYDYLKRRSYPCIHTREPGGTRLGEHIRKVLLHSRDTEISDMAELFLFEAARSQIVRELIRPALARREIVICDRFSDATFSYQGYGGKVSLGAIRALDRVATGGMKPHITLLLDVDTMTGLRRARRKGIDRMEKKEVAYHKRVRAGYLKLAGEEPARVRVIRSAGGIKHIQDLVRREVELVIQRFKRAG
jgi:dTMP kinase